MNDGSPDDRDADRVAQWVREQGGAVRGYLLGLVRRPDVADDLTQEVFWRAWRSRERYREAGTPRAYLLKIADRLAWDHCRTARREVHLDEETWSQVEPPSGLAGPADKAEWSEAERELAEALGALSPDQRRVLLLRYYGGLEFSEIARQCGSPLGTVLSHCHRGLHALRKLLAGKSP
jgi:RNA polymerase sigma-70 factor (ECF subfamily)